MSAVEGRPDGDQGQADEARPRVGWGEVCGVCLCLILSSGLHADGCPEATS